MWFNVDAKIVFILIDCNLFRMKRLLFRTKRFCLFEKLKLNGFFEPGLSRIYYMEKVFARIGACERGFWKNIVIFVGIKPFL